MKETPNLYIHMKFEDIIQLYIIIKDKERTYLYDDLLSCVCPYLFG